MGWYQRRVHGESTLRTKQLNMKVFIISACLAAAASAASVYAPAPVAYKPAPAYHAETYPDEISPYTYTYAVADDYSKANFNAEEASDGASNVQGSYSVALPDGRIQHVKYSSNGYDGYVADVTYEGKNIFLTFQNLIRFENSKNLIRLENSKKFQL